MKNAMEIFEGIGKERWEDATTLYMKDVGSARGLTDHVIAFPEVVRKLEQRSELRDLCGQLAGEFVKSSDVSFRRQAAKAMREVGLYGATPSAMKRVKAALDMLPGKATPASFSARPCPSAFSLKCSIRRSAASIGPCVEPKDPL